MNDQFRQHIANPRETGGPRWSYAGRSSPEYWADLTPNYALCRCGKNQSPIDIITPGTAVQQALAFDYQPISPLRIVNSGWTLQIIGVPSCDMIFDEQRFELRDVHFHTPSEHRIDGALAAMELHLVHQNAEGALAIAAILADEGTHNATLAPFFDALPLPAPADRIIGGAIDPAELLPSDHACYHYAGSRTVPPCTEGVDWLVFAGRIQLSAAQIGAFREMFELNARPLQPVNGREIYAYRSTGLRSEIA
jgi:carbonic anhydrase